MADGAIRAGNRRGGHGAPHGTVGALPNLVVIGAMKCGTTSLHRYLELHPDVQMSIPKELCFFLDAPDGSWHRGVDWYREHFDPAVAVRGDASPAYANLPRSAGTAERMARLVPDARLIYAVRDPIDRAVSNWVHATAAGFERRPLEVALAEPDGRYVQRSRYATQLREFLRFYPDERVLVVSSDELLAERRRTLAEAFAFLGVDPGFESPGFERRWEDSVGKGRRYRVATGLARRYGRGIWSRLSPDVRWRLERLARGRRAAAAPPPPQLPAELRARLVEALRPEAEGIRELSGKPFEAWSV